MCCQLTHDNIIHTKRVLKSLQCIRDKETKRSDIRVPQVASDEVDNELLASSAKMFAFCATKAN